MDARSVRTPANSSSATVSPSRSSSPAKSTLATAPTPGHHQALPADALRTVATRPGRHRAPERSRDSRIAVACRIGLRRAELVGRVAASARWTVSYRPPGDDGPAPARATDRVGVRPARDSTRPSPVLPVSAFRAPARSERAFSGDRRTCFLGPARSALWGTVVSSRPRCFLSRCRARGVAPACAGWDA
jgi:hypothetical protein